MMMFISGLEADKFQKYENDKVPINSKIPNHLYKKIYKDSGKV